MKASKRVTADWAVLVSLVAAAAAGCSNSDDNSDTSTPVTTTEPTGGAPTGDATTQPTGVSPAGGGAPNVPPQPTVPGPQPTGTVPGPTNTGPGGTPTVPTTPGPDGAGGTGGAGPAPTDVPQGGTPNGTPTAPTPTDEPGPTPTTEPTPEPVPEVPEPSLVVSSNNNYWNEGEVTVVQSGTANFTVNTNTKHQKWHGWGGTFNEQGWSALQELSEADRQRAMRLLFGKHDGLDLDWGRIPMGPSDYAVERYTLSSGPGQFSIDHDLDARRGVIPYIKAAQAIKGDVKYWGSPWTPPPWAKEGYPAGTAGYDKGHFNRAHYGAYADFFIAWIQAYEAQGIPIDAVMPQNEPGWAQDYPTCAWGPATDSTANVQLDPYGDGSTSLATFVDAHLFPAIDAAGLETKVWFGTLSNNRYFPNYWGDMMAKPTASRIIGAGLQWETQLSIGTVRSANANYLIMQSEHKCGNYPWLSATANSAADANRDNFLASMAPNNHAYGEESWDLIKSWIDDGVHIYSAWNMVLDTGGFNLDENRRWPQNALLVVDRNAKTLQVTAYYHVFRHVAQYVDLEATRVGINGNALAFQNPDGSVVAIVRTTAAGSQIVSIDGTLLQFQATGNGWATVNWKPAQ